MTHVFLLVQRRTEWQTESSVERKKDQLSYLCSTDDQEYFDIARWNTIITNVTCTTRWSMKGQQIRTDMGRILSIHQFLVKLRLRTSQLLCRVHQVGKKILKDTERYCKGYCKATCYVMERISVRRLDGSRQRRFTKIKIVTYLQHKIQNSRSTCKGWYEFCEQTEIGEFWINLDRHW